MTIEEQLNDAEWRLELALAQLEAIYKRTCESCKHFNKRGDSRGVCFNNEGGNIYKQSFSSSFGCNKWMAQDD